MKKIVLILIGIFLLSSCGSKRKTTSRKYPQTKKVTKRTTKTSDKKVVVRSKRTKTKKSINKYVSKTIFDDKILDDLYDRKPNLNTLK